MFKIPQVPKEVDEAVRYALREVAIARPANPVQFVAEKLQEWAAGQAKAAPKQNEEPAAAGAGEGAGAGRSRRRAGRGRRGNVFAPPVAIDANWKPTIVPKTDEEKAGLREIMKKNIVFGTMDADTLETLIDVMVKKEYNDGDAIITQGDPGDYYYVLQSGTCDIFKDGELVLKVTFGMGFGELALMYDAPRAATVQATSKCVTWAIDRDSFKQLMMGTTTRKREKYTSFLQEVEMLKALTDAERMNLADALVPMSFEAGEVIIKEGDTVADRFYIVESGEAKGTKSGKAEEVCPRLKAGGYFGELALIKDQARAATITAVEPTKCLAMDRAAFVRLLGPMSDVLKRQAALYAKYEQSLPTPEEQAEMMRAALAGDMEDEDED